MTHGGEKFTLGTAGIFGESDETFVFQKHIVEVDVVANSGQEFLPVKGLDDIVVTADVETFNDVCFPRE